MSDLRQTIFHDRHVSAGAEMMEFGGWEMPVYYPTGIVKEHLATRKGVGLFDVSHMGRFVVRGGASAVRFLQHVLTNNVEALDDPVIRAQYTFIPNREGGAVDDAYLYRFQDDEYFLVVNAANREKDWRHLHSMIEDFEGVELFDRTDDLVMLSLQGPQSRALLELLIQSGSLPEPRRNTVSEVTICDTDVMLARTGYTGEPLCFELFFPAAAGLRVWDRLVQEGAVPNGLGARDTLRLEAGLPLYGHELGLDHNGAEIPLMACPLARFAVSFSSLKASNVGRAALARQHEALQAILKRDFSRIADLPRRSQAVAVAGRGVAREGARVYRNEKHVGHVTSGTRVPLWTVEGEALESHLTAKHELRSICMALIDSDIVEGDELTIEIRGRPVEAVVVPCHLRGDAPPYARPIVFDQEPHADALLGGTPTTNVARLLERALRNTQWRQFDCINLIPSEMTVSPMVRLSSVMDPSCRYAEHKQTEAFYDADISYYQGTDFILEVERKLRKEMHDYLGCEEVEPRIISGQMANTAVFSAVVDYLNRTDRKCEPRRMRQVLNHHISKGGHLSAQPMGALRDYVARDPHTERPAVVGFPSLLENPYEIDLPATLQLIDRYRPTLIIFGRSMVLHREPVTEIRRFLDEQGLDSILMYDMAHVLGLVGPHFQEPFAEGVDLVTGSTHKTFFGTQRGIIGGRFQKDEERFELWKSVISRTFPGSVSNHHLGTLLGLLMATYEMNTFKDEYQAKVIANAKSFARALRECGLDVGGDPGIDFTETHQVIVEVGYGRGAEMAARLEDNNIICNYQASAREEGFTAAGALRFGVAEMTRFGMEADDFGGLAELIRDVVARDAGVVDKVRSLRHRFREMRYCFPTGDYADVIAKLREFV